ncbi:NAD(P)-dependent dehydrogenase, short-chain alcohol dehydrogenase family [Alteribacillus persepolensis]|uniref:NAD(P)-dependent dehydrogenase, short-chain alcohol dehydrogenase family n=1 Tax=Alteribacillus persepolensis TaxID=568899 RepID=A0A1G8B3R9_9BACI|nr:SDR family NAD(P)-dependent oxidoreductase [Alteribacillus persepolensis]SDH27290.1 NAD(P)-dependent dehydrogenase, short-chain alcohol dehydrogenase family [Alteribacillus persepolensis]
MDFKNRVVLITGSASKKGIGRETARQVGQKGAAVVLTDIDESGLADAKEEIGQYNNGKAMALKLDVKNKTEVNEAVQKVIKEFGKIDILINNAGISRPTRVQEISEEEWDLIFDINMKGIFFLTQAVLPHMKECNYGRIVNLSSVSGKRGGGIFGGSHYSAAKAAVTGFTKAVARETAAYGITCNTVAPGLIGGTNITSGLMTEDKETAIVEGIPAGRVGEVKDVAYSITFLASEGASYITGEELDINGGSHID